MMLLKNRRLLGSILTGLVLLGTCTAFIFLMTTLVSDGGRSAVHFNSLVADSVVKIDMRTDAIEAKGIRNTGNICFASAVAQTLFRIDSIRNFVLNSEEKDLAGMKRLFKGLADSQIKVVTEHGREFVPSCFTVGQPGDSEEFYITWMETFEKFMPTADLQEDLFLTVSQNRTNLQLHSSSISTDFWTAVRVNFPDGPARTEPINLETLLSHPTGPFSEESLTETLIQSHKIVSFPKFLAFVIVRTAYDPVRGMVKVKTPLNAPEYLNLSKHAVIQEISTNYKLKMFVVHRGDSGGHYFSYVRDDADDWKIIDDEQVKISSVFDAIEAAKMATICFYERV